MALRALLLARVSIIRTLAALTPNRRKYKKTYSDIHGCPAVVIEWEGSISVTWIYPDSSCIIDIYSEGESAATVLRVAESIEPIQ